MTSLMPSLMTLYPLTTVEYPTHTFKHQPPLPPSPASAMSSAWGTASYASSCTNQRARRAPPAAAEPPKEPPSARGVPSPRCATLAGSSGPSTTAGPPNPPLGENSPRSLGKSQQQQAARRAPIRYCALGAIFRGPTFASREGMTSHPVEPSQPPILRGPAFASPTVDFTGGPSLSGV